MGAALAKYAFAAGSAYLVGSHVAAFLETLWAPIVRAIGAI